MKKALLSGIILLMVILAANAVPYSTIGQLRAPDAYVLPHKSAEFTFTNYLRRVDSDFVGLPKYKYVPMGMVNIGLFDRVGIAAWAGDKIGLVDVKVKLVEETATIPQLAIGVDNLFSPVREDATLAKPSDFYYRNPDKELYEKNSPYICITKASVLRNLTGLKLLETYVTLGIGRNKFKGQVSIAKRFEGLFATITVKPHKAFSVTFEDDGSNLNVGGTYTYKNFGFKLSYVGLEEQENNRIGLAVSYLFDKFADARRKEILMPYRSSIRESDTVESQLKGKQMNTNTDLLEELKKLRDQREQAQKVLDDLRNQLKELEQENGTE